LSSPVADDEKPFSIVEIPYALGRSFHAASLEGCLVQPLLRLLPRIAQPSNA
jgi:hypothetical protein